MARRLSTYVLVCSCLATASLALAAPGSGLALERHVSRVRSAHPQHRCNSLGSRRRARKVEKTRATCASKRASAKSRRASGPAKGPTRSSTTASAVSGSLASTALPPAGSELVDVPTGESHAPSTPASESPAPEAPATKESPTGSNPTSSRKLVWSDEFNGPAGTSPESSKWSFDTGGGGWGNEELESYTSRPANAELDGQGHLAITARAEKYTGADGITRDYTSARLQTLNTFQFKYGLAEARIKVPAGQGLVAQFWALGHEGYESEEAWPGCGEIDIAEVLGSEPNIVNGTLHAPWPFAPTGVQGQAQSATPLSAGFHTYSVEWEPERISFMLDGSVYKTITPADLPSGAAWPFKHPYFLLLDLAVGGEWPGSPNASTHFPAQMLVDWVRVWQ
jgi:beta-glucanase (GH16 family)